MAGGAEDVKADPKRTAIAHDLVEGIRTDLTVDWADRQATEAKVRAKIKRLLRKHSYQPPRPTGGGGRRSNGLEYAAQLVLDQAKVLYRSSMTRLVAATSPSSESVGFWTMLTL